MSKLKYEGQWVYYDSLPSGEKAIHILPGDDLQYAGSSSLNSDAVTELVSAYQGTLCGWLQPNWSSTYNGTLYVFDAGSIEFYWDGANTQWKAVVNGVSITKADTFAAAERTYFHLTWDSIAPTLDLAIDGSSAAQVTTAQTVATVTNAYVGQDSSGAYRFNGKMKLRVGDTVESSYYGAGSGDSDMMLVDSNTRMLDNYSDDDTGATIWHRGCTVSVITDNGSDATLTTPAGSDNRFVDGNAVTVSDGTGYAKQGFIDGSPSSTSVTIDDGAGSAVADIGKVGVSIDCDAQYYAQAASSAVHDIITNDVGGWAWVQTPVNPTDHGYIIGKRVASAGYAFAVLSTGVLHAFMSDGADAYYVRGLTDLRDGMWHHVGFVFDKDNAANCKVYVDGVDDTNTRVGTLADIGSLSNSDLFTIGALSHVAQPFQGKIADVGIAYPADIMAAGEMGASGEILTLATNPHNPAAWCNTEDYWLIDEGSGTTLTGQNNDLTLSSASAWSQEAFISRNLVTDGDMENGGIGAWTVVGTPATNDKETDTDSGSRSLHFVADAAGEGCSQDISASSGDKFYLYIRYKVTAGSFKINFTNGGGDIDTGISDATWTGAEYIITATGNLTMQFLSEAASDDVNISEVVLIQCVAGDSLDANTYYTLVYNTDTTTTGAAWSGLGSEATEVAAGDLYVVTDTVDADTASRTRDFADGKIDDVFVANRAFSSEEAEWWHKEKYDMVE